MRTLPVLFFSALLVLPFAVVAKKDKAPAPRQFIDRSVVVYPKSAPGLSLVEASYSAESWASGVGLHYRIDAAPEIRLDVFVYPLGRSPATAAVEQSMVEVKAAINDAAQKNTYSAVVFGGLVEFPIAGVAGDASADPEAPSASAVVKAPAVDQTAKQSEMANLLSEAFGTQPIPGSKLAIGFDLDDRPRQSLAYTFYKQLFLFKIRITGDTALMNPVRFNELADGAAKVLIPAITVFNEGQCGTMTINTDGKAKDAEAGANQLIAEMGRVKKENCAAQLGPDTVPVGSGSETIAYPDNTWKSN